MAFRFQKPHAHAVPSGEENLPPGHGTSPKDDRVLCIICGAVAASNCYLCHRPLCSHDCALMHGALHRGSAPGPSSSTERVCADCGGSGWADSRTQPISSFARACESCHGVGFLGFVPAGELISCRHCAGSGKLVAADKDGPYDRPCLVCLGSGGLRCDCGTLNTGLHARTCPAAVLVFPQQKECMHCVSIYSAIQHGKALAHALRMMAIELIRLAQEAELPESERKDKAFAVHHATAMACAYAQLQIAANAQIPANQEPALHSVLLIDDLLQLLPYFRAGDGGVDA